MKLSSEVRYYWIAFGAEGLTGADAGSGDTLAAKLEASNNKADVNASTDSGEYRLAPGDKLGVLVFDQAQLSGDFVINGDGQILLPLAGSVIVAGLTLTEAPREFHRASRAVGPGGQHLWGQREIDRSLARRPAKVNRRITIRYDKRLYRKHNCLERVVGYLKINRAIATRYDQLADSFLGILYLASARYWIKFCPRALELPRMGPWHAADW
jgi:Polysaccharide biosynthesis/export protein